MKLRSLLFVPGDRPERIEKARGLGADALILDLEDSVSLSKKAEARAAVAAALDAPRTPGVAMLVRINPLDGDQVAADIELIRAHRPDGVMLPKAEGADTVRALAALVPNLPPVLPIATETAKAIFVLGSYGEVSAQLSGLTWGAEDLPAAVGAATSRDGNAFLPPYEMARSLTMFAAHAAGVPAIETVFPDIKNIDGLADYVGRAARDGFTGMMAIHPSQVAVINAAFTPTDEQLAHARAVVAAFDANPTAGALQLDGKMIDAPHLKQARALLARA